jgi:hypothetical protein
MDAGRVMGVAKVLRCRAMTSPPGPYFLPSFLGLC